MYALNQNFNITNLKMMSHINYSTSVNNAIISNQFQWHHVDVKSLRIPHTISSSRWPLPRLPFKPGNEAKQSSARSLQSLCSSLYWYK